MAASMTSIELAAFLQYTRHANMRRHIREQAQKHGFDVKSMESSYIDKQQHRQKQYIVPADLCHIVIKYSCELEKRRATMAPRLSEPPVHAVTPVLSMIEEVVAILNSNPDETLRLSRIAIKFGCTESEAAKKLAHAVKSKRIKCAGTVYAANSYKFEQNLTQLSPAEREYRVLHPTRSYSGFAIESKSSRQDSLDKQLQIRPGTPWALKTTHSLQK